MHDLSPARSARLALAAIVTLLLAIIATPLLAIAAPPAPTGSGKHSHGKGDDWPRAPLAVYPLQGDSINPTGSSFSEFRTSFGDTLCAWCFYSDSTVTGTVALLGYTNPDTPEGVGIRGWGRRAGVEGYQSTTGLPTIDTVGSGVYGYGETWYGVFGESSGSTGVFGKSTNAPGVWGVSTSASGVSGESDSGAGVFATSNSGLGVYGSSITDAGVWGLSTGSNGVYGRSINDAGVFGNTDGGTGSPIVAGVEGVNYQYLGGSGARNAGVYGHCTSCMGVVGISNSYIGVKGLTTGAAASYGGYFSATAGIGLFASSNTNSAIQGTSVNGAGVRGNSTNLYGVYGNSSNNYAVVGISNSSIGVRGVSTSNYGFYAGSTSGYGGIGYTETGPAAFRAKHNNPVAGKYSILAEGDVRIVGNLICTGSCTTAMGVGTNSGERLMYAEGAAQNRLTDEGTAMLKNGRAVVKIERLFAQTISLSEGYQVFLTPVTGDTYGLGVVNQTSSSFEVVELGKGKGSFSFHWRISALRKGTEKVRMAEAPADVEPLESMPVDPPR